MLNEEEERYALLEPRRTKRIKSCFLPCSLLFNAVQFVAVLVLLGNPCIFSSRHCTYVKQEGVKLLSEEHGLVPEFGLEKVTFMNDSRYATEDMFTDLKRYQGILENWEGDMPLGRGFVQIPPEGLDFLERPYHITANPTANGYSIASLHQFHCLYMILRAHGNARFGLSDHNPDGERHMTHCFDYLRQSAQCAGDAALEGKSKTVADMTDGWGNTHVCKNNSQLIQWVYDNRLSDNTGIH